jgi:hypothetical protein
MHKYRLRLSQIARGPRREIVANVLLLLALLSAGNAFLSFSAMQSNTHEIAVALPSTPQLVQTEGKRIDVNVAVVVPFHRCQALSRLHETFEFWRKRPPCTDAHKWHIHLSLVLYYSEDLDKDSSMKRKVHALIRRLPTYVRRCFDGIHFLSARLAPTENIFPLGPCHQFYVALGLLRNMHFSHWTLTDLTLFLSNTDGEKL